MIWEFSLGMIIFFAFRTDPPQFHFLQVDFTERPGLGGKLELIKLRPAKIFNAFTFQANKMMVMIHVGIIASLVRQALHPGDKAVILEQGQGTIDGIDGDRWHFVADTGKEFLRRGMIDDIQQGTEDFETLRCDLQTPLPAEGNELAHPGIYFRRRPFFHEDST